MEDLFESVFTLLVILFLIFGSTAWEWVKKHVETSSGSAAGESADESAFTRKSGRLQKPGLNQSAQNLESGWRDQLTPPGEPSREQEEFYSRLKEGGSNGERLVKQVVPRKGRGEIGGNWIRQTLRDPQALKRAFVVSELLAPPLAVREKGEYS